MVRLVLPKEIVGVFSHHSAGWRLSEEEFMKDIPWIYNLKLRASWGQLGNERIDLFRYVDLMNLKVIKNDGSITDYNYPLNGAMQSERLLPPITIRTSHGRQRP